MNKLYIGSMLVLLAISTTSLLLHFTGKKASANNYSKRDEAAGAKVLPIAFFRSDSITSSYEYYKDIEAELQKLSSTADGETMKLQQAFDNKTAELEKRRDAGASEEEIVRLNQELSKMRTDFAARQENTINNLQKQKQRFEQELKKRITDFVKAYNTPQRFSYILADEPGFIYYRDSALDITADIVKGLNEAYRKEKK